MKAGRKPLPTKLKLLKGTAENRRLNKDEPDLDELISDPPECLSEEALQEWRRLEPELTEAGILAEADLAVFASYCQAYGRWVQAEEELKIYGLIDTTPKGYMMQHALVGVANRAMELMNKFGSEIGLTPSSRSRIVPTGKKDKGKGKGKGKKKTGFAAL